MKKSFAQKKGIISVAYRQGKMFSRFREKEKFVRLVADFGEHKNTIIFKINVLKLIDQHPKSMKSSVTLSFLKKYLNDIKGIGKSNLFKKTILKLRSWSTLVHVTYFI